MRNCSTMSKWLTAEGARVFLMCGFVPGLTGSNPDNDTGDTKPSSPAALFCVPLRIFDRQKRRRSNSHGWACLPVGLPLHWCWVFLKKIPVAPLLVRW